MLLFVYGTLLPRFGHPLGLDLEKQAERRGRAEVSGKLFDQGEYPVAVPSEVPGERIFGELFDLSAEHRLWRSLDEYEDFKPHDVADSLFERCQAIAWDRNGRRVDTQVYWYRAAVDRFAPIAGGDYLAFLEGSSAQN